MNPNSETLIFGRPGRSSGELPIAEIQRAVSRDHRPDAAAAARARIAELAEPRIDPAVATAPPLITDKAVLAANLRAGSAISLPRSAPQLRRPTLPSRLQPLAFAVGIFLLTLLAFKLPVIISQLDYHPTSAPLTVPSSTPAAAISANPTLIIPKINVSAPVVFVSSNDESQVLTGLESGVVHYANTAMPGQNGNAVFFGHSSNDWWQPGSYKFVFVLLDKLAVGDTFEVDYQSVRYTYKVTNTQVVDPTDVGVLQQTDTPTATLITCSPPGTSWRRLVVSAQQIDPAPKITAGNGSAENTTFTSIPGNSPSWWQQFTQAIGRLFGQKPSSQTSTTGGASPSSNQSSAPNTGSATLPDAK